MIVEFVPEKELCKVTKQESDRRYTRGYALPESGFLYTVLQHIKKMGHDVIKKRMWKDGHLVDDTQQYIRTRKFGKRGFYIFNSAYACCDLGEDFNKLKAGESLELKVLYWNS